MKRLRKWYRSRTHCPLCDKPIVRALFMGLPVKLCPDDDECGCVYGLGTHLMWLPTRDGRWAFTVYEGSYWAALWWWMWNGAPRQEDEK